jgi:hypothetical protein
MRSFGSALLAFCLILALGTVALADGFQMDKVTIATRHVEDEDVQNWIYFNSNAKYDWMRMNLQGKLYIPQLSENWIDYSRDGMGDLYSGLRANFRFPEFCKGLDANLGYKMNDNYWVLLYGAGYGFSPARYLSLGFHYDAAHRSTLSDVPSDENPGHIGEDEENDDDDDYWGDLDRRQLEFTLGYNPKGWGYFLTAQRIDYEYEDHVNNKLRNVLIHDLKWQATSKIDLGLSYKTRNTEYPDNPSRMDGDSNRIKLYGSLKWDQYWTWSSAYTRWDYSGEYSGNYAEADFSGLNIKVKYTPDSNWWAAAKLYINDYFYDDAYRDEFLDFNDIDADYNSRNQRVIAVEYERKLDAFTYNLEVFVKNFDYDDDDDDLKPDIHDYKDGTDVGIIGAIGWDWVKWHWVFRVAPNGDLSTRKANWELRATYRF